MNRLQKSKTTKLTSESRQGVSEGLLWYPALGCCHGNIGSFVFVVVVVNAQFDWDPKSLEAPILELFVAFLTPSPVGSRCQSKTQMNASIQIFPAEHLIVTR